MNSFPEASSARRYCIGDLALDVGTARVSRDGVDVPLRGLSFDLLLVLARAAPDVVSHDDLLRTVWRDVVVGPDTISQRIKLLREALGDDSRDPRYVVGVRGRGYRLKPPVVALANDSPVVGSAEPEPGTNGARPLVLALGLTAVAAIAVGVIALREPRADRTATTPDVSTPAAIELPRNAVAVLPFDTLGTNADDAYIGRGIAEMVMNRLGSVGSLIVVARGSVSSFENGEIAVSEVGQRLGARYLVRGTVQRAGGTLRVTVQLIDAQAHRQVHALKFDRPAADLFLVQDEIATQVAAALDRSLSPQPSMTTSVDAYLEYLRGLDAFARYRAAEVNAAVRHFVKARQLDPGFAAAYIGEARARAVLAELLGDESHTVLASALNPLIDRALELDPELGEAYILRAQLAPDDEAEATLRRGLELAPNSAEGYLLLATLLSQREAQFPLAIEAAEHAVQLNPLRPRPRYQLALLTFLHDGDADGYETRLLDVLRVDPNYTQALNRLAQIHWTNRARLAQAIAFIERAIAVDPGSIFSRTIASDLYLALGETHAAADVIAGHPAANLERVAIAVHEGADNRARSMVSSREHKVTRVNADLSAGFVTDLAVSAAIRDAAFSTREYLRALEELGDAPCLTDLGEKSCLDIRRVAAMLAIARIRIAMGRRADAVTLAEMCIERIDAKVASGRQTVLRSAAPRAMALATLGRNEEALETLYPARNEPILLGWLHTLEHDSTFDAIRGEARFQEIIDATRKHAGTERATLAMMRKEGRVPMRP